jgi:hypothetical protein
MLLKREDLRGRMIRLIGQGRISATTRAMDDAGSRVARYLTMLLLVNVSFGLCIAIGLYFIGVPNAALGRFRGDHAIRAVRGSMDRGCGSCADFVCSFHELAQSASDARSFRRARID